MQSNPKKLSAIKEFEIPKTVKSFLGLTGYYRKFIRNFANSKTADYANRKEHAVPLDDRTADLLRYIKGCATHRYSAIPTSKRHLR